MMHPLFDIAALAVLVSLPAILAGPTPHSLIRRDPPPGMPACATESELKYQPLLDFDKDGCYNTAAIDRDGNLNPGQDHCFNSPQAHCRDESDLDTQNVYSRRICNNGWCAFLYDYYFEKDQARPALCWQGHRHDWEHIVVWVEGDTPRYVAASAHGSYDVREFSEIWTDGNRAKIVYHKDGHSTHAFRFAKGNDDEVENHKGKWFQGALLGYTSWPDNALRLKAFTNDWGAANVALTDEMFTENLEKARGPDVALDTSKIYPDYGPAACASA